MAEAPRICILLATFEPHPEYFRRQVESLRAQDHPHWKCFVCDDASSPEALATMRGVLGDDPRFVLLTNQERLGSYLNFERAMKSVPKDASFVALSDQDDVWVPHKLSRLLRAFADPMVLLAHSDLTLVDKHEKVLHASCWRAERRATGHYTVPLLLLRNTVTGCTTLFRRSLVKLALPFPRPARGEAERRYHHDLWLALVALTHGSITAVDEPLVLYRQHDRNVVGASSPDIRSGPSPKSGGLLKTLARKLNQSAQDFTWRRNLAQALGSEETFSAVQAWKENRRYVHQANWLALRLMVGEMASRLFRDRS